MTLSWCYFSSQWWSIPVRWLCGCSSYCKIITILCFNCLLVIHFFFIPLCYFVDFHQWILILMLVHGLVRIMGWADGIRLPPFSISWCGLWLILPLVVSSDLRGCVNSVVVLLSKSSVTICPWLHFRWSFSSGRRATLVLIADSDSPWISAYPTYRICHIS